MNVDPGAMGSNPYLMMCIDREIPAYEKFIKVKEDDIVVDFGASYGPFSLYVIDRCPKKLYCVEPSKTLFPTLIKNFRVYNKDIVTLINKGIYSKNCQKSLSDVFFDQDPVDLITFKTFIEENSIDKINFLKMDMEGGEYDVFIDDNIDYIINNIDFIIGEWHLGTPESKNKFKNFRDKYLKNFKNFKIIDISNTWDITWDLYNDHFIEFYTEVIIHIFVKEGYNNG